MDNYPLDEPAGTAATQPIKPRRKKAAAAKASKPEALDRVIEGPYTLPVAGPADRR